MADSYAPANSQGVVHLHIKGERPEIEAELVRQVKGTKVSNTGTADLNEPIFNPQSHKAKTEQVDLGEAGSFSVHKGALHRALGVPQGQKIPASKLAAAAHSKDPHIRRMAASAAGLKAMAKGRSK